MINQLKFGLLLLKSNIGLLKRPYKLNLYLTDKCNFRCKTCNIWKKKTNKELNMKELSKFFRINNHWSWIDITGGEIFLRKDIDEIFDVIIKECKNLYLLHFPTNGFLTNKIFDTIKHIKKHFKGKLIISISIDGPKELHDSLKEIDGSWEKAIKTFKKINSMNGGNVFFGYTISKYNADKLKETFIELKKEISELDYNKIHINIAQNSEIYYSNSNLNFLGNKNEIRKNIDSIISKRKFEISPFYYLETRFLKFLRKFISENIHSINKCMALNSTVSINPRGDIYPCLFFNKKLGNIKDVNYKLNKIIENKESKKLKKNILNYCPNCWTACEAYPSILANLF